MDFLTTLSIACIPALISGIVTFLVTSVQARNAIKQLRISSENEIKRLAEQHEADIDSVREKYRLEMEQKEKDHQHNVEIMQIQHKNEMALKECEMQNALAAGTVENLLGKIVNSQFVQKYIENSLEETLKGA